MADALTIHGTEIKRGEERTLEVPLPPLYTHAEITMPVRVIAGKRRGPCLLLSAALHGDELNGLEIIRRVTARLDPEKLRGTVIAVPVVNVYGLISHSRYLPDRRDLNRSFPGSANGSLAARIAHVFMKEIVSQCNFGIDLHTAAVNRINGAQIRANLKDEETRRLAEVFNAPVMVHSATRDGSLREASVRNGIPMLVFEGGEPLRFNYDAIEIAVRGVLRVMTHLGMRRGTKKKTSEKKPITVWSSTWIRARRSGIMRLDVSLGDIVKKRQRLGVIADPLDENPALIRASDDGVVLGHAVNPLVHRGDGIVHVGSIGKDETEPARLRSTTEE